MVSIFGPDFTTYLIAGGLLLTLIAEILDL